MIIYLDSLDIMKEGNVVQIMNGFAKIIGGFLKLDIDKWSLVKLSEEVKFYLNSNYFIIGDRFCKRRKQYIFYWICFIRTQ